MNKKRNQREYQLLQWYPSLPDDWEEGEKIEKVKNFNNYHSIDSSKFGSLPPDEVENNPKFWKEITRKDYQILSFTLNTNSKIFPIDEKQFSSVSNMNEYLNRINGNIHSVKRLIDNEIFTVGDIVKDSNNLNRVISKIKIYSESYPPLVGALQIFYSDGDYRLGFWDHIKDVQKREYKFTTQDGYKIYKGDQFYPVCIKDGFAFGYEPFTFCSQQWTKRPNQKDAFKYFKKKKNAKHWADFNRLEYSKKDINRAISYAIQNDSTINLYRFKKELNLE